MIKLIECQKEYIRIWDFHKTLLLKKIQFNCRINCLCLWNTRYLFAGCKDSKIRLIYLDKKEKNRVIQEFSEYNKPIISIRKINHRHKYGECIVSQGLEDGQIILFGKDI